MNDRIFPGFFSLSADKNAQEQTRTRLPLRKRTYLERDLALFVVRDIGLFHQLGQLSALGQAEANFLAIQHAVDELADRMRQILGELGNNPAALNVLAG